MPCVCCFALVLIAHVGTTCFVEAEHTVRSSTCDKHGSSAQRPSMLQSTLWQRPQTITGSAATYSFDDPHMWQYPSEQLTQDSLRMHEHHLPAHESEQVPDFDGPVYLSELRTPSSEAELDHTQSSMVQQFADDLKSIDALRAELAADAASVNSHPVNRNYFHSDFGEADKARHTARNAAQQPSGMSFVTAESLRGEPKKPILRPHKEEGLPEKVEFGLYASKFYGADLKEDCFTVDTTMTLQWSDPRAVDLVPSGAENLTLSDKEAQAQLWLPQVEITNRRIRSYELISSAVIVNSSGIVSKIERALVVIMDEFQVEAFPYDTQLLTTRIASSKYMLSDLILVPAQDPELSGAPDDLCEGHGFEFMSWKTRAIDDGHGMLQKSRGLLELTVKRSTARYTQEFLIPGILLLCISWGVFWFPFIAPFITPRLALSILALLSFTTMSLRIDSMLPPGAPFTWSDLFIQNCQWMMFFTVQMNIVCEIMMHTYEMKILAPRMNNECKALWPCMALTSFSITFFHTGGDGLGFASHLFKSLLVLEAGLWYFSVFLRYKQESAQKADEAAAKEGAQATVAPGAGTTNSDRGFSRPRNAKS